MLQAKDIYGWQFSPSYFEIVTSTLKQAIGKQGALAPVAQPAAPAVVPYNLGKQSPPPPLVEGALYGVFYPTKVFSDYFAAQGANVEKAKALFAGLQAVAWKDPVEVFIPGYTPPKGKSECLFFPTHWSGRVSDRGTIGVLPLLTLNYESLYRLVSFVERDIPTTNPTFVFAATFADSVMDERMRDYGAVLRWEVLDARGLANLFPQHIHNAFSFVRQALENLDRSVGLRVTPMPPSKDSELKAVKEFGELTSPAIIPNVGWDELVTYVNAAARAQVSVSGAPATEEIAKRLEELYGWSDFGSEDTVKGCMTRSQGLYGDGRRRYVRHDAPGYKNYGSRGRALGTQGSEGVVFAGFQWWGMANSGWLDKYETLVKQQVVIALYNYISASNRDDSLIRSFKAVALPFHVGEEVKIPNAIDFVNEAGNMSPTGRRFFEDYIVPVVEAGGTPPNLTPEEAAERVAAAKAESEAAREAASSRGAASKAVTAAKKAQLKAEADFKKKKEELGAAISKTAKIETDVGPALAELEKLKAIREQMSEMGLEDAVAGTDAKIVEARKKVGGDFEKAQEAQTKAQAALDAALDAEGITATELDEANAAFRAAEEAREEASVALTEAESVEKAVKALASYVYVPSSTGYRMFIQDVRKKYDKTPAGTSKARVSNAFRWFSGCPQATAGREGKWAAGSEWQTGADSEKASGLGVQGTLGGFMGGGRRRPPKPVVVAGPVPVDLWDGTQQEYQSGRPRNTKAGVHIVFEDFAVAYGNEFAPLFAAYKEAFPERNTEAGFENLVIRITEDAATSGLKAFTGEWLTKGEPVAFFVEEFTPIEEVLIGMDPEVVKDLPLGENELALDPNDDYVILPKMLRDDSVILPKKNPDHRDWSLSRGRLVSPDGKEKSVKRVGKGTFATVYQVEGDTKRVVIEVPDDIYDKEILAEVYRQQEGRKNPHLPAIEYAGTTRTGRLYLMDRYKMPLRKANTKNWKDYQALRACWEEALRNVQGRHNYRAFMYSGHEILNETVECSKKHKVKKSIRDALGELRDWSANYGSSYTFEISPRNVGTDAKGNLVLVDVLFDMNKLAKARGKNTVNSRLKGGLTEEKLDISGDWI